MNTPIIPENTPQLGKAIEATLPKGEKVWANVVGYEVHKFKGKLTVFCLVRYELYGDVGEENQTVKELYMPPMSLLEKATFEKVEDQLPYAAFIKSLSM